MDFQHSEVGNGETSSLDFETSSKPLAATSTRTGTKMRKKKAFEIDSVKNTSKTDSIGSRTKLKIPMASDRVDNSACSSSFTNKTRVMSRLKTSSRRRHRSKQDEEDCSDEASSMRSSSSSCAFSSQSDSILGKGVISRVSVRRGMGSSAYAVQDAGTYQMIHDECSYLCSTILSKRIHPSKMIQAAIDLVTLLSDRKTRSILWQGGNSDGVTTSCGMEKSERNEDSLLSPSKRLLKLTPIPKIWSSIFDVLAMATATSTSLNDSLSSNSSVLSAGSTRAGPPSKKSRTKSARRKEKEVSETGGIAVKTTFTGTDDNFSQKLSPELKHLLACILYFVSLDCTMSGEHSVAAMGAVKSSSLARKIRLSILERGAVVSSIMTLMSTDTHTALAQEYQQGDRTARLVSSTSSSSLPKILPNISTSEPPVSPLRQSPARVHKGIKHSEKSNNHTSTFVTRESDSMIGGDPTAMGRRNRKNRRKIKSESAVLTYPLSSSVATHMEPIPEQMVGPEEESSCFNVDIVNNKNSCRKGETKGRTKSVRRKLHEGDELSFADTVSQKRCKKRKVLSASQSLDKQDDDSSVISQSTAGSSVFMSQISQKIATIRSKVHIESCNGVNDGVEMSAQKKFYLEGKHHLCQGTFPKGDCPWLTIVCLEALTRILAGKEKEGQISCLEGEITSEIEGDENDNILMLTNRLLGKSGIIFLLANAMKQSMIVATKLIFAENCPKPEEPNSYSLDKEYWCYCHSRLNLLASLIDEACFFSDCNRQKFCEDDPFSFEDRKEGLIFHILIFLRECLDRDLYQIDQKRSEVMSLALRTLTSLTHDNPLAAEQLKVTNTDNRTKTKDSAELFRGVDVLAKLLFNLEENPSSFSTKLMRTSLPKLKKSDDHNMYRYDCTLFCLTTFANIIEGASMCRILMEIDVVVQSGQTISWLKWLCQWIVKQTASFRDEILAIGSQKTSDVEISDCRQNVVKVPNSNTTNDKDEELHKHEEENLVAAGNGCIVLACLMTELDDDDPESLFTIRKLVKDQMPLNRDNSPSGLKLIVNTLKAYCNYYQISMGQVSFAIVAPVKELIAELENVIMMEG